MRNRKHDIERYLRGELSPAEMHALEKEALNDPFLAEALEGVDQAGADNFLFDLHRINRSVHDRARPRKRKNQKTIRMWGWTTGIAATLFLIAVSGYLVISLLREQRVGQQSMNHPTAPLDDPKVSADSITAEQEAETDPPLSKKNEERKEEKSIASGERKTSIEPKSSDAQTTDEQSSPAETIVQEEVTIPQAAGKDEQRETETASGDADPEQEQLALAEEETEPIRHKVDGEELEAKEMAERAAGADAKRSTGATLRASPVESILLKGRVVSASDGQALPGVNVLIKGSNIGTVTDAAGNYELRIPRLNTKLVFSFIGFGASEVDITNQQELNVALEEDTASLSEVVVSGYTQTETGNDDGSIYRLAEPAGGRTDFKNYLSQAVQYPVQALQNKTEGKVTVRFTVEPNGQLTDFEVLKGIGSGCDEELIRAIRHGPSWKPSTKGDRPLRDQVKVRFRFQLPSK